MNVVVLNRPQIERVLVEAARLYVESLFKYAESERSGVDEVKFRQEQKEFLTVLELARQAACRVVDRERGLVNE